MTVQDTELKNSSTSPESGNSIDTELNKKDQNTDSEFGLSEEEVEVNLDEEVSSVAKDSDEEQQRK